jgi:HEAT repeat protein
MNPEKRVSGLEMLREAEGIDPDALRSAYRQALTDSNGEVRATALQGLATLDRDNSLPLLQEAMDDADSSVRLAAVDGMEVNDESRPLLEKALKDTDESVRELAGLRLGIIH